MLLPRFVGNAIVVAAKGECPTLDAGRCHRGYCTLLTQQVLEGLVVGVNGELPAKQILVEAFDPKHNSQTLLNTFSRLGRVFARRMLSASPLHRSCETAPPQPRTVRHRRRVSAASAGQSGLAGISCRLATSKALSCSAPQVHLVPCCSNR